jgi:acetyl esterase/lipase
MKIIFKTILCSTILFNINAVNAQEIIPLYNSEIPNSKPAPNKEKSEMGKDGILRISNVSIPTLSIYKPEKSLDKGAAVIICPGGGYKILAASHEGADVAKELNKWGITAFVLKYRIPNDTTMQDKSIGPLQDASGQYKWFGSMLPNGILTPKRLELWASQQVVILQPALQQDSMKY